MPLFGASYSGPKEVSYLFIDGEQLRRTAEEVGKDWFGQPVDIDYRELQAGCQKVFYYDCLPAKQFGADEALHQAKLAEKRAFFNRLRSLPGWHVSEGLARHRKKARQEQKEVDILIAVDMLTHTHRKNMHRLRFVSGDQDFAPLLEAVVRDGMYVELLYPHGHTSQDLMHFADVAKPMDVDFLYSVATQGFQKENSLPKKHGDLESAPVGGSLTGEALRAGVPFARSWRNGPGTGFTIKTTECNGNKNYWTVCDGDELRARRYFTEWMERDFGVNRDSVEWMPRT